MRSKRRYQGNSKLKIGARLRNVLILIAIGMIAIGSGLMIKSFNNKIEKTSGNVELYRYTNRFQSNSKINLKENDYIKEDEIADGQVYLSDLISGIDIDFDYKYDSSRQTDITYDYKIEALVNATYSNTKDSYNVLNKSEILKEEKDINVNSQNFDIKEKINVDYAKYHQMVKDFKQTLGISIDSYLNIKLTVDTKTNINSKEVKNQYISNYKITVGDKVAAVDEKNNDDNTKVINEETSKFELIEVDHNGIIISMIIMIIGLIWLRIVLKKTEALRCIKNEFKIELHKIMKSYEDKIVEIQGIKNLDIDNATKVKDILQLRKLAEEALVPIYCYIKDDINNQEAYFIVTKYDNNYIYILR